MASCVEPLVTGFAAAAGGTAEFYQAGTSTPSVLVYSDPEGTVAASAPHTLDGSGSIVRYVKERVRVVVKTSAGATVKEWTHGQAGETVGIENPLFNGALSGGGTGPGGLTTLDNGLTLLATSLAAEDGYVNPGTGDVLLSSALASSSGLFFNVKTGYGAAGNGVADDTAEIQAAANAGVNAGGGVLYIPPGTFSVTAAVSAPSDSGLRVMGVHAAQAGSRYSRLQVSSNGLTAGFVISTSHLAVSDMTFAPSAATITSPLAAVAGGALNVRFDNCTFLSGAAACVAGLVGASGAPAAIFNRCYFKLQSTSGSFVTGGPSSSNGTGAIFDNCVFDFGGLVPGGAVFDNNTHMFRGCTFLLNSATGGVTVFPNSAGTYNLVGCRVISSNTSGTNTLFQNGNCNITGGDMVAAAGTLQVASSINAVVRETGCNIPDAVLIATGLGNIAAYSSAWQNRYAQPALVATTVTPSAEYAHAEITQNTSGTLNIVMPASPMYPSARYTVSIENTGAGSTSLNFGSTAITAVADNAATTTLTRVIVFRWQRHNITTAMWTPAASGTAYTST
jgi:hypothetical protein